MHKIKDSILLGFVAGLLGAVPGRLLNKAEYKLGLTDSRYEEMAAIPFVNKRDIKKPMAKNIGRIANGLLCSVVGVSTTYVLKKTGRDHAILKGIGITSLSWLGLYSFGTQTHIRKSKKPLTALLSFVDHLIFGATTAIVVSKLGDDNLFPSNNNSFQNRAPFVPKFRYNNEHVFTPPTMQEIQHHVRD